MKSSFGILFVVVCVVLALLCFAGVGDAKVGVQSTVQVQLVAGDNWISIPAPYSVPMTTALGNCYTQTIMVIGYYAEQSGNDTWRKWAPDMPAFLIDLWALEPGRGYTARLSEACLWTPGAVTP